MKIDLSSYQVQQIGIYEGYSDYDRLLWIVEIKGKPYVVGGSIIYQGKIPEKEEIKRDWSLNRGEDIAYDYFFQTKPVISIMIDEFLLRYQGLENLHILEANGSREKGILDWDTKNLLINYIVNHHLTEVGKKDGKKIQESIDQFMKENLKYFSWRNKENHSTEVDHEISTPDDFSLEPYSLF